MDRRKLDLSIISDVHLGTYECHARELLKYLKSIQPEVLVLNGDFIDKAKAQKKNFPKEHQSIIQEVLNLSFAGTKVYCITNNLTNIDRHFAGFSTKTIQFRDKLELQLKGQKYWIFHGAGVDTLFKIPAYFIRPNSKIYDLLLQSDRMINAWRMWLGKARLSYAGRIKNRNRHFSKAIHCFEKTAAELARQQGYDYVICGHVHQPIVKEFVENDRKVTYMNAGDWVENLSALEYRFGKWKIYHYDELDYEFRNPKLIVKSKIKTSKSKTRKRFGSIVESKNLRKNRIVGEK